MISNENDKYSYNTNKIGNNTNYNYNTNIYINNYMTNDSTKLFKRNNNRYKERALSLKNYKKKGSQIKQMIEEDKKKYGDKKYNKDFIFVSQSPKKDLNNNDNSSFRKNYSGKESYRKNNNYNTNNLNVVNMKVLEIKNMNDTMINTVNNIENYLNYNFNNIELKLNKIDNFKEQYNDKKNLLDEKINNIILNDEELIIFVEEIEEKDINNISIKNFEEIINRFMILILVNKNNNELYQNYNRLLNKLLDCKKVKFNEEDIEETNNNNYQKYKISFNLENNLQYLFKSLNN